MYACGIPSTCSNTTSSPSRQRSVRFRPATHASTRARFPRTGSGLNLEWLISKIKALCPGGAVKGEAFDWTKMRWKMNLSCDSG